VYVSVPHGGDIEDFTYEASRPGMVDKALLAVDLLVDLGVWFCLTGDVCTDLCPAGVRFRDVVQGVRAVAVEEGITEHGAFCERCGRFVVPVNTVQYIQGTLKGAEAAEEYLRLCPSFRRYEFTARVKDMRPGRSRVVV